MGVDTFHDTIGDVKDRVGQLLLEGWVRIRVEREPEAEEDCWKVTAEIGGERP